ncbi:hypothetical protein GALL_178680 [mine drainage metagenome]|uniref:EF-hand domain-containing protein n=1 Tax=mine drainage metagenome TaxID=410659 RepID=A0A1J5RVQ7_9ZZZZ
MRVYKPIKLILQLSIMCCLNSVATFVYAEGVLSALTVQETKYTGPSVEDNIAMMDTDKNGFADVYEVRAFLALKHGKDYQKELLDQWEASARGKSCSTPFAKDLYLK